MSKGKVYHHEEIEEEEEEDIDLGFEEEEEIVTPNPYKNPQTEEQCEINRLTQKVADKDREIMRLKKDLEWANKCSNDYSNESEERWQEIQKLKKQIKYQVTIENFIEKARELQKKCEELLKQGEKLQAK